MRAILALLVLCTTGHAAPPPDSYRRGVEQYQRREYEAAVALFKASYETDPRREFLFAWAQAERLSGDCESAIALYEKYLATAPSARQVEATEKNRTLCTEALASSVVGKKKPSVAVAPPPPDPLPPLPWEPNRRALAAGGTLLALGVCGVAAGSGLYVGAEQSAARSGPDYAAQLQMFEGAQRMRAGSLVALSTGGALVVAGTIALIVGSKGRPKAQKWATR